jgi:ABC-type branched-subunit amino acid transport system ATPase component/ABC-type branched-subunit amino acid transport system permease subunit
MTGRPTLFLGYLAAVVLIAAWPFVVPNDFYVHVVQDMILLAMAATGLNILFGMSGQLSLGQAAFFALGAYGSGILATKLGWPLAVTMPVGVVVAGAAGVVIGLVALRARTHYLAMATLAFGFIVEILCQRWVDLTGGSMGLIGVPQLNFGDFAMGPVYFFWTAAAALVVVQTMVDYLARSATGRSLYAIKESESFALTVGIPAAVVRAGVFVVAAMLAGLAGAFFAHQSGYLSSDAFNLDRSIGLLIAVVLGGLGRPYGAIVGAIIVVLLNQLTAGLYEISYFIFGAILLLVMLFFPDGAVGALERLLRSRRRPVAAAVAGARVELPSGIAVARPVTDAPALELDGITKRYAGVTAVSDVRLQVKAGSVHALIGPNGAGKSTLINVIAGLYAADGGRIRYHGRDITALPAYRRAEAGMARTFQNLQLIGNLSVLENVMLGLRPRHGFVAGWLRWLVDGRDLAAERAEAMALLEYFGIARFADCLPGDLAYGHRKLCELARALAQRPTLMLLDEPIAGLNEEEVREIVAVIGRLKELGLTILVVEHNMTFVMQVSDTVTVLDYGRKIGEGTPDVIRRDPAVIAAYLGQEAA